MLLPDCSIGMFHSVRKKLTKINLMCTFIDHVQISLYPMSLEQLDLAQLITEKTQHFSFTSVKCRH